MSCNCEHIDHTLYELLDGDCTSARQEELLALVKKCPGCFEKLGIEKEVRALVRQCCCSEAPQALKETIRIKISTYGVT
ncbi:mycothiol system anti-sigma-R factor [Corynebacterium sp. 13CS0277]|uniref:mycothiol system anti-sigma-R factor n=1 Tax=Corynebacterium sp. 13CS0277 TaxID=2071994 RepID=UPI000D02CE0E|nr:mycothiol system anti-sigma-R factor [Corynebacterium sp. 13CS0277]PRQ10281.1 mycothiol system anti-sigma-R factor [Corynebacterium sp. 13CS0277]